MSHRHQYSFGLWLFVSTESQYFKSKKFYTMKYEFKVNGTIKLIIKPESNLEIELFKELFSGEVKVVPTTSTNPSGEVVVEKIEKIKTP